MNDVSETDERLIAGLLRGQDPNIVTPPFRPDRPTGRRHFATWSGRLAAAAVVVAVAGLAGTALSTWRDGRDTGGTSGAAAGSADPAAECGRLAPEAQRWGAVNAVAGGFRVTAETVAKWQENRDASRGIRTPSNFRGRGTEPLLVCFFDGDFDGFPGRGQRPAYDRLVVIFDATGWPVLDSVGPRDYLKVELPR